MPPCLCHASRVTFTTTCPEATRTTTRTEGLGDNNLLTIRLGQVQLAATTTVAAVIVVAAIVGFVATDITFRAARCGW